MKNNLDFNLIEAYGWIPLSCVSVFISYVSLEITISLASGVALSSMFLSNSLLRFRVRKIDGGRFRFGLLLGGGFAFLTIMTYLNMLQPTPVWVITAMIPAFLVHYLY